MLLEMMRECRNFFVIGREDGVFTVSSGALSPIPEGVCQGQYVAVSGSTFNDGVWKVGAGGVLTGETLTDTPTDEQFTGTVYALRVPREFVALAAEIDAWREKAAKIGPLVSESFGPHSYSVMQGSQGGAITWQEAFAARLGQYRRMFKAVAL